LSWWANRSDWRDEAWPSVSDIGPITRLENDRRQKVALSASVDVKLGSRDIKQVAVCANLVLPNDKRKPGFPWSPLVLSIKRQRHPTQAWHMGPRRIVRIRSLQNSPAVSDFKRVNTSVSFEKHCAAVSKDNRALV